MQQKILILDFGSQVTQLIARKVRELNIYCEIHPHHRVPENIADYTATILSGSPCSVREKNHLQVDLTDIKGKMPLLGICYGAQYLAHFYGGEVGVSEHREYGRAHLTNIDHQHPLFNGIKEGNQAWMSHSDTIIRLPENATPIASTKDIPFAAFAFIDEPTYGLQFHPEVHHSENGTALLKNFLVGIAHVAQDFTPECFIKETLTAIKEKVGDDQVVLGLSGGVDSTVTAVLLHQAIGENLHCIFVNNGLLRNNEYEDVLEQYQGMGLNVRGVDASNDFLMALHELSDPEQKRKAIGRVFIETFDREAQKLPNVQWLAQGTIYPDVIESVSANGGPSATIKSHHNVGGLPDTMNLKIVEPLRTIFKDEVRRVGKSLGISSELLGRHPFPGPGLAIRILGAITPEKVRLLQEADHCFMSLLKEKGLYDQVWQAGVILLPVQSVGVMGDERTYENAVALRAVTSVDGMTADWADLPYAFLQEVSNTIINRVRGINRVVYDISSKPPATIEWE